MDGWLPRVGLTWWGSLIGGFVLSMLVTWLSIRYARRRNLIDHPGRRRSHEAPTPRGGGTGIVVAALVFFCGPIALQPGGALWGLTLAAALALVALVGWMDDHRPLSVRLRLAVQILAVSGLWLLPMLWAFLANGLHVPAAHELLWCVFATVLLVWSINLHNFMDGINGLLACQATFVFAAFAGLSARAPLGQIPVLGAAATTLGFLPFNFPRARIFMGDVGSYALGLLIPLAACAAGQGSEFDPPRSALLIAAIASSGFVVDATCNLLSRLMRGRRWYSAHREHLYQWMTRTGMSHARVVGWYMAWNLVVVAPVLWLLDRIARSGDAGEGPAALGLAHAEAVSALLVYGLGIALWIFGKRWCLHKVKSGRRHGTA